MASTMADGAGWPSRKWDHISRVAMVLNISRGVKSLVFEERDLASAEQLINDIEANLSKCFAYICQHINAEQQERILKVLRGQVLVKEQDIIYKTTKFFRDAHELRGQMMLLKQAGVIHDTKAANGEVFWKMLKEPY